VSGARGSASSGTSLRAAVVCSDTGSVRANHPFTDLLTIFGTIFVALWVVLILRELILVLGSAVAAAGRWRIAGALRPLLILSGARRGGRAIAFEYEVTARVHAGDIAGAKGLIDEHFADGSPSAWERNAAINALISAGSYRAALRLEPTIAIAQNAIEAMVLILCHINLAEAEYNLGRWDAAETRLRHLDLACGAFDVTRAGLLQQRAWIAGHRGDAQQALDLCGRVNVNWLPKQFHAEYHFTRAVALIAAGQLSTAEKAACDGDEAARRLSSKRNALFVFARIVAARGDWAAVERNCRAAANHRFRTQGGDGLLLWAEALEKLGRSVEAAAARQLVVERDPESEAAQSVSGTVAA
jgi:tetratricopeptide (TPR) repeat protein